MPQLRAERKDFKDYDPRWTQALKLVTDGVFGDADYFEDLVASVNDMTRGNDWFLLANGGWGWPGRGRGLGVGDRGGARGPPSAASATTACL